MPALRELDVSSARLEPGTVPPSFWEAVAEAISIRLSSAISVQPGWGGSLSCLRHLVSLEVFNCVNSAEVLLAPLRPRPA